MTFVLNGTPVETAVDPLAPLASVLQQHGLPSVRVTCGVGVCGACSVLVDGKLANSCIYPAGLAAGSEVTTSEGLGPDDPVQRAFVEATAFQCGYCTPGFVMAVHALLDGGPEPDEEAVRAALVGNLCRCGSYNNILDAVRLLAGDRQPAEAVAT